MAQSRPIAEGNQEVLQKLKTQLAHNYTIPFYRTRMDQWAISPDSINTFDDFRKIPFMKREDQVASFDDAPPFGSLWDPDTVLITHTPAPGIGLVPEYHTREDIDACAKAVVNRLGLAGVTKDDIVVINSSYHLVISGHTGQSAFVERGGKVLPLCPFTPHRQP